MKLPDYFYSKAVGKKISTSCVSFLTRELKADVTRDDSQRRFLAQHSVATLLPHGFEWLQHCSNIAMLCCAKNRRCQSSCVTTMTATATKMAKKQQICTSLHEYNAKMPNFTFCRRREDKTTIFLSLFLNFDTILKNSTPKKFAIRELKQRRF